MKSNMIAISSLKEQYRKLLSTVWSPGTVRDALDLADAFLNASPAPLGFSTFLRAIGKSGKEKSHQLSDFFVPSRFLNYLKELSIQINGGNIPALPERMPKRKSPAKIKESERVFEIIYNLSFPAFSERMNESLGPPKRNIAFFRDIQSLLFFLTAEYILPEMRKKRMKEESDFASLIMFSHCLICWHKNPAHQNQLLSVLFNALGFQEAATERLYNAFRLTAPDEHDYLTKAQAYWTALMDAREFDKAEEFVLRLLRRSPEEHFEELKEIVELNFELRYKHENVAMRMRA